MPRILRAGATVKPASCNLAVSFLEIHASTGYKCVQTEAKNIVYLILPSFLLRRRSFADQLGLSGPLKTVTKLERSGDRKSAILQLRITSFSNKKAEIRTLAGPLGQSCHLNTCACAPREAPCRRTHLRLKLP